MPDVRNLPTPNRLMKFLYSIGLGPLIERMILLLTTTDRRTGLPRVTPLQYEEESGKGGYHRVYYPALNKEAFGRHVVEMLRAKLNDAFHSSSS